MVRAKSGQANKMKKMFLILLGIGFSVSVFAEPPTYNDITNIDDTISAVEEYKKTASDTESSTDKKTLKEVAGNAWDGTKTVANKVGTGIKTGFNKATDAVGLSKEDINVDTTNQNDLEIKDDVEDRRLSPSDDKLIQEWKEIAGDFESKFQVYINHLEKDTLSEEEISKIESNFEPEIQLFKNRIGNLIRGKSGEGVDIINKRADESIEATRYFLKFEAEKKDSEAKKQESLDDKGTQQETLEDLQPESESDGSSAKDGQSAMSKVIGGVSTAAMGVGGMQLAQGLSEQKSDKAATAEMQSYLSGMYCRYGVNRVDYGKMGVIISEENQLDLLREEFFNKAAELKNTKEQLGLKEGIESQVVFDKSETGLYSNEKLNRADSYFGRLSSALQDENGRDAQMLDAQSKTSKNRVIGGAIAVGAGAAASIGGNALINKIKNKQAGKQDQPDEQKPESEIPEPEEVQSVIPEPEETVIPEEPVVESQEIEEIKTETNKYVPESDKPIVTIEDKEAVKQNIIGKEAEEVKLETNSVSEASWNFNGSSQSFTAPPVTNSGVSGVETDKTGSDNTGSSIYKKLKLR